MRKRIQAAWLTVLFGSAVSAGTAARAADGPLVHPLPTAGSALTAVPPTLPPSLPPPGAAAQAPIVTTGPVYAYGPVVQRSQPRQRTQKPNWSGRNIGRYNNLRPTAPYGMYQAQGFARPWQYARPRYDGMAPGAIAGNRQWRGNAAPYSTPYDGYRGPWTRPQSPNALAWYDRSGQQNDTPYRVRQPNWRY
jgi:hypothetical protein